MDDDAPPPQAWPLPIYTRPPFEQPPPDDPAKTARQYLALGWTFLGLSLAAPPVLLPYAFFYGWQARRRGEAVQGTRVLVGSALLTAALSGVLLWGVMRG